MQLKVKRQAVQRIDGPAETGSKGAGDGDLDQLSTTTKPVKMISVAHVPGLSRNLLSARKAVEQWVKSSPTTKPRLFWGSWGRNRCLGFTTRMFSCLGNRRLASGVTVALAKGGGQLVLDCTSSGVIRYLGGGYIALSEAVEGVLGLGQEVIMQNFIKLPMRIPRVHRRVGSTILM